MNNSPIFSPYSALHDFDVIITEIDIVHRFIFLPHTKWNVFSSGRRISGFVYCAGGGADYDSDDFSVHLATGNLLYLPAETKYTIYTAGEEEFLHYTANFRLLPDKARCGAFGDLLFGEKPVLLRTVNPRLFASMFTALLAEWNGKKGGYLLEAKAQLYRIAHEFFTELAAMNVRRSDYEKIFPAVQYLDEHFTDPCPISFLAQRCRLSETHMRRLFGSVLGTTPHEYCRQKRIMLAKDLLLTGLYTVGETASRCGFPDSNYFSRVFRAQTGVAPTDYRRMHSQRRAVHP